MASASAGSIFVDLLLRDAKYTQGLGRATTSTEKFVNSAGKAFKGFAVGFASAFTVGTLVAFTKSALDTASQLKDLSDRLGLGTTELQRYTTAANLAGVSSETFETAITKLNSQIAAGELGYKSTSEALEGIADRVKNAKTNIEAAGIANEAFGAKMGAKLLPFLKQGSEGIKELGDEAERLGIVINADTIDRAEKFGDSLELIGKTVKNNFNQGLLGAFVDDTENLADVFKDPEFAQSIKAVGAALGEFLGIIAQTIKAVNELYQLTERLPKVGGGNTFIAGPLGLFTNGKSKPEPTPLSKSVITDADKINELLKKNAEILANGPAARPVQGPGIDLMTKVDKLTKSTKQLNKELAVQKKEADELANESLQDLNAAYEKNYEYITGVDAKTRDHAQRIAEITELYRQGAIPSAEEYTAAIGRLNEDFKEANEDMTVYAEQAARNIQDAFADFLFDPFAEGTKGMLKGFVDTLRKMAAQQIASNILGADKKGGGALGGLIAGFGKFTGLYADGGFIPPGSWGIAGEAGAEMIYGGKTGATVIPQSGGGGNVYQIDARGADAGAVQRIEQALISMNGPGVIERRVLNAEKRGEL